MLLPCKGTSTRYHNTSVASGNSIVELWERLDRSLYTDQKWNVLDTKTGKTLTPEEFNTIVCRLKG